MKHLAALALAFCTFTAPIAAQTPQEEARLAEQREALAPLLARIQGHWRGTAKVRTPEGETTLVQTERVGPMLGNTIAVIEGRGYAEDGSLPFNAFAVISFDPDDDQFRIRSWANGRGGDFPLWVTDTGFRWEIPAGPATVRYVAHIDENGWHEVGTYEREGMEPMTIVEMHLRKLENTQWPQSGAVEPE